MASTTSERKDIKFLKKCGRGALMGMPRPCPLGSSSWVLGLSYDVYIFFCTSIGSVRNWSKAGGYIVFVSLSFEYGRKKSVRQLTGFFRYVEIVITKLYVHLNWMFYIKSPYLRISKISSFFIIMSSSHEKIFVWNASIWVGGPCK